MLQTQRWQQPQWEVRRQLRPRSQTRLKQHFYAESNARTHITHKETTRTSIHTHDRTIWVVCGYGTIRYERTDVHGQNDFYLLQFSSDSLQTLRVGSPLRFLSFYATFTSPPHPPHDLFNFKEHGSTPTFSLLLFLFSSTLRALSPLLRGAGCNRPMVYYCFLPLLYSNALRRLYLSISQRLFLLFPFSVSPLLFPSLRVATSCRLSQRLVCVLPKVSLSPSLTHASPFEARTIVSECPPLSLCTHPFPLSSCRLSQRLVCVLPKAPIHRTPFVVSIRIRI